MAHRSLHQIQLTTLRCSGETRKSRASHARQVNKMKFLYGTQASGIEELPHSCHILINGWRCDTASRRCRQELRDKRLPRNFFGAERKALPETRWKAFSHSIGSGNAVFCGSGGRIEIDPELHVYWRLYAHRIKAGTEALCRFREALAICFGGDPAFGHQAKVMRTSHSLHFKGCLCLAKLSGSWSSGRKPRHA